MSTTTRHRSIATTAVLLVVLALLLLGQRGLLDAAETEVLGVSLSSSVNPGRTGSGTATAPGQQRQQLGVSGAVSGLAPGVTQTLRVTVRNPNRFPVVVTDVSVAVGTSDRAGCAASTLSIGRLPAQVTIAATGTRDVTMSAVLLRSAPDACKGARWPLTITVAAGKENQQ
ncbi:MAG: hypothetical protein ACLGIR_06450 [Actinomycetes bacterium]